MFLFAFQFVTCIICVFPLFCNSKKKRERKKSDTVFFIYYIKKKKFLVLVSTYIYIYICLYSLLLILNGYLLCKVYWKVQSNLLVESKSSLRL